MSFVAPLALKIGALAKSAGITKAGIATTLQVGGAGISAVGSLRAGQAQEDQSKIEAQLAEAGAISEETRASEERTAAVQAEIERSKEGRRDISRVVARTAGQGIELAGTPLLQITDFLTDIQADIKNIQTTGARKAGAATSRAASKRLQGLTLKQIGKAQKTKSRFKAGSSLLTGIGGLFT